MTPPDATNRPTAGSRLRKRRRALRLTLREVSEQAGITESYLSQIERDRASASVNVLQRICEPLRLSLGDLFSTNPDGGSPVSRFREISGFSFGIGGRKIQLTPQSFDHLQVLIGEFEPGGSTGMEPYSHGESEELLLVLEGEVCAHLDGTDFRMSTWDSMAYSSDKLHGVTETTGTHSARVLWAISPPSY